MISFRDWCVYALDQIYYEDWKKYDLALIELYAYTSRISLLSFHFFFFFFDRFAFVPLILVTDQVSIYDGYLLCNFCCIISIYFVLPNLRVTKISYALDHNSCAFGALEVISSILLCCFKCYQLCHFFKSLIRSDLAYLYMSRRFGGSVC